MVVILACGGLAIGHTFTMIFSAGPRPMFRIAPKVMTSRLESPDPSSLLFQSNNTNSGRTDSSRLRRWIISIRKEDSAEKEAAIAAQIAGALLGIVPVPSYEH